MQSTDYQGESCEMRCPICGVEIHNDYEICDACCEDPRDDAPDNDDSFDAE